MKKSETAVLGSTFKTATNKKAATPQTDNPANTPSLSKKFKKIVVAIYDSSAIVKLKLKHILYFGCADNNKCLVVFFNKYNEQPVDNIFIKATLSKLETLLQQAADFRRIHKSHIVNMKHVFGYKQYTGILEMKNHEMLHVSRRAAPDCKNWLLEDSILTCISGE